MKRMGIAAGGLLALFCIVYPGASRAAMIANPLISQGKPIYGSSTGTSVLVDGKFGTSSTWTVAANSWVAINVGAGPTRVFFNWNNPDYSWSDTMALATSCYENTVVPRNYNILTSSNSTNGSDGTWTQVDSARGNTVAARGHLINFTGASWVKMSISTGGGTLDEIQVFDCSQGAQDIRFFCGTSISANTYKNSPPPADNYMVLVDSMHPGYYPAMIRGGIPCIYSTTVAANISKYLAVTRGAHYWAIEMGTNDAYWGADTNLPRYIKAMQTIIDSCKAAGIQPVIARLLATDSALAKWEVNPKFLTAIDSLTTVNNLIPGPDFYTWFRAHTGDYNTDGIHPNAQGSADIQRLWANKMSSLYTATAVANPSAPRHPSGGMEGAITAISSGGRLLLCSAFPGTASVFTLAGALIGKTSFQAAGSHAFGVPLPTGCYLVRFTSDNAVETVPIFVHE